MSRFKEALHFLSDNCGITSQWLVDIVEYLEDRSLAAALAFSRLAAATAAASSPAACSSPASPRWPRVAIGAGPVGVLGELGPQLLLPLPTLFPRGSNRRVGPNGGGGGGG
uniref:Uncharacterized protein n=1 Tax=Oryza rufipogon TaxID=4529 RepID=A0A0E0RBJ8_ORYRU